MKLLFCLGLVLFCFMAYQSLQVIYYQTHYYTYKQFYFKQFSLAKVHFCLRTVKCQNSSIQAIQFSTQFSFI